GEPGLQHEHLGEPGGSDAEKEPDAQDDHGQVGERQDGVGAKDVREARQQRRRRPWRTPPPEDGRVPFAAKATPHPALMAVCSLARRRAPMKVAVKKTPWKAVLMWLKNHLAPALAKAPMVVF
ncbi:MAG: hypothetical protein VX670_12065, partial [Candidatus Latescibacterota bacterium]|nr:hypothetical protein [Candidatus Latescibacterota bacterium]